MFLYEDLLPLEEELCGAILCLSEGLLPFEEELYGAILFYLKVYCHLMKSCDEL